MRNTQGLKEFVLRWKNESLPCKKILYEYKPFCIDLLYEDEELVREVTSLLRKNIEQWAKTYSEVYSNIDKVISKQDLFDKSTWYVNCVSEESMNMATSGSTTGSPFSYLRWDPFLYFIEAENHYDLIMDEYSISNNPDVMYFFNTSMYDKSKIVTVRSDSKNFMEHHGLKRKANVHYINFSKFKDERESYLFELSNYLIENKIDVIFAPGSSINSLCYYLKKNEKKFKMCSLLSNSNERLKPQDALFLLNGYVDNICDHMRCWDGGASFFTCVHKNYHLMDNLSWCYEVDQKLVSTDYFSLPSPFVNYWNGDFCRISNRYERCECGRLYRDFEFLENRPFSLKGRSISELKDTLNSLRIRNIKQVRCTSESVEIVSYSPIQEGYKQILRSKYRFDLRFVVEE